MNVAIREEAPSDVAAIHRVTVAAFRNAPHTDHTEQFIVEALREARALTVSLVAEQDGRIVGHVAVSPVSISEGASGWYGLGPISVAPEWQRQGIGSLLMQAALHRLREARAAGCVLVGDPAWYARFGFRVEPGLVFPGAPPEYLLALPLASYQGSPGSPGSPSGTSPPRGVVTYHEAFGATGSEPMQPAILSCDPGGEFLTEERCHVTELSNSPADEALSVALARVEPGVATRWHRLRGTTERYVILSGAGLVEVGDLPPRIVTRNDVVVIPPGCRQRITNCGTVDLVFHALCTPRFRPAAYEDSE